MSRTPSDERSGLSRLDTLRGMRWWSLSGAFGAVYSSITAGAYATGYALHLGASNAVVGLLSAAPSWGQLLQMVSPLLIERLRRRKPLVLICYAGAYSVWLLVALIPFLFAAAWRPWAMVALIAISGATVALALPASTSWFADLVPADTRGRFVARQRSIVSAMGLVASLWAGRYLDSFTEGNKQAGFVSLFIVAVVFGLVSAGLWSRVPEPPKPRRVPTSVMNFLMLPLRHGPFRRLALFVAVRAGATMVAAPFFAVYMLEVLAIPYTQIALFSVVTTLTTMAASPLWGYLADKFGYKPLLRISSAGIALIPLMWFLLATRDNYWLTIPAIQAWGGAMGAGVMLAQFNLLLKTAPKENRSIYLFVAQHVLDE